MRCARSLDDDDPTRSEPANRLERSHEGVWAVAEVDVDAEFAVPGDQLGAPRDRGHDTGVTEGAIDGIETDSGLHEHHDRECGISGHVAADERHAAGERTPVGAAEGEPGGGRALVADFDIPLRRDPRGRRDRGDRDAGEVDPLSSLAPLNGRRHRSHAQPAPPKVRVIDRAPPAIHERPSPHCLRRRC